MTFNIGKYHIHYTDRSNYNEWKNSWWGWRRIYVGVYLHKSSWPVLKTTVADEALIFMFFVSYRKRRLNALAAVLRLSPPCVLQMKIAEKQCWLEQLGRENILGWGHMSYGWLIGRKVTRGKAVTGFDQRVHNNEIAFWHTRAISN